MRAKVAKTLRKIVYLWSPQDKFVEQVGQQMRRNPDLNGRVFGTGAVMWHPNSRRAAYQRLKTRFMKG